MPNQKSVAVVNGPPCPRCQQVHTVCAAHTKSGQPCRRPVRTGQNTCATHGGNTHVAKQRGQERRDEAAAHRELARLGITSRAIHPGDALVELVQYQASMVDFWRRKVSELDEAHLTWGTTRVKDGGDDRGTTKEAKPNIAYVLLDQAQARLAEYATAALKAGVEERRVRLAESQGALVAQAIRQVLDQLHLTPAQLELVPRVVPAALRLIAGEVA